MTERRWAERRGLAAGCGAAVGVLAGGVTQAASGLVGGEPWNWAELALYVLVWSVLGPPVLWLAARMAARFAPQSPSGRVRTRQSRLVAPAVRSGVLPRDVDPVVSRRALRVEAREWNDQRWPAVVVTGLGSVAIGAAAVVADDDAWGVWLVAVVVAAEGLVVFRWSDRRRRVAERLLAELADR